MFGRVIFAVILGVAAALFGSFSLLERLSAPASVVAAPAPDPQAPAGLAAEDGPSEPPQRESFGYREALLEADQRGQYAGEALINGLPVHMLVDTGASDVFVSASTARRLGLTPSGGRKRAIQTANGQSVATPALLGRVSLGGLYMNDVEALVLAPEAGEINLLGESFLKRLVPRHRGCDQLARSA
jgi:aspartyl protease family protein